MRGVDFDMNFENFNTSDWFDFGDRDGVFHKKYRSLQKVTISRHTDIAGEYDKIFKRWNAWY